MPRPRACRRRARPGPADRARAARDRRRPSAITIRSLGPGEAIDARPGRTPALGLLHVQVAGADDHIDRGDGLGPVGQRGDRLGAAHPVDLSTPASRQAARITGSTSPSVPGGEQTAISLTPASRARRPPPSRPCSDTGPGRRARRPRRAGPGASRTLTLWPPKLDRGRPGTRRPPPRVDVRDRQLDPGADSRVELLARRSSSSALATRSAARLAAAGVVLPRVVAHRVVAAGAHAWR